jgi:hypothetical protein
VRLAFITALLCVFAGTAGAWTYLEHTEIGQESYRRACTDLEKTIDKANRRQALLYEIACARLPVKAQLYGQAVALAGDRFTSPDDFRASGSGWKAASRKQYLSLALTNNTHFHPIAPRQWRKYHKQALNHGAAASKLAGLDAVERFELAVFHNAFADHFLHDSFAAGHMGFNRPASSVAASLAFHDAWNEKGRTVRDRLGRVWTTYGDGGLNNKENRVGRARVIEVSTRSVAGLLQTFMSGARDVDHELDIWRRLPFAIEATALPSTSESLFRKLPKNGKLHPLGAINRPALKDRVLELRFVSGGSVFDNRPLLAALAGFDLSLPLVGRSRIGVGGSAPYSEKRDMHFVAEFAVMGNIGKSLNGLFHHQLAAGALWELRTDDFATNVHAGYLLDFEIGRNIVRLEAAPAWVMPEHEFGFFAGISYARVLSASGGGVR